MAARVRPYIFYDVVLSICPTCYAKVEGKIVFQDGNVYLLKKCSVHGASECLLRMTWTTTVDAVRSHSKWDTSDYSGEYKRSSDSA